MGAETIPQVLMRFSDTLLRQVRDQYRLPTMPETACVG